MKISLDGGALNPKDNQGFGTSTFSENLVKALNLYDKKINILFTLFRILNQKYFG